MNLISSVTSLLSVLTVVSQILIVLGLASFFFKGRVKMVDILFSKYLVQYVFVVPIIATLGSLFFSEVAHYTPCVLCWYQRILMYPQAFILTIAYFRKENLSVYAIVLSAVGAIVAFYHYLLQLGKVSEILPCSAVGYSVSCAQKFTLEFGYITIPMMALSAFLLIIVLSAHQLRLSSGKK